MPPPSSPKPRRSWSSYLAIAAAVVVVLALAAALLGNRSTDTDASSSAPTSVTPTASGEGPAATDPGPTGPSAPTSTAVPTEQPIAQIDPATLVPTASSTLPTTKSGLSYGAGNLLDGDLSTAWAQAGSKGGKPSIGAWVSFALPHTTDVTSLEIINGYVKSDEVYAKNDRPKTVRVSTDTGAAATLDLADAQAPQTFQVDFPGAHWLQITVTDIYPGWKWHDVAMTEVRISGRDAA